MRVYVVKNKNNNKYWIGNNDFTTKLSYAFISFDYEHAEKYARKLKDCYVETIVIGEIVEEYEQYKSQSNNLQEENRVLKKALKLACEAYYDIDCCPYCLYGTGKENLGGEELIQEIAKHFIQQAKEMKDDDI